MPKPTSSDALLIIVELGAEWPSLRTVAVPSTRRVLSQAESESPGAFAARVGEHLNDVLSRRAAFGSAILACNERVDGSAQVARGEVARSAAHALARTRGGSLRLTASDRNGGRSRAPLAALVGELSKEWRRAGVDASLSFSDHSVGAEDETDSQVRPSSRRARPKPSARRVA